jgi:hypothetical protein
MTKTYLPSVQVVKGRPRADSWHVGAYIANQKINNCPHEGEDTLTPHQIYYCQEDERTFEAILGESA